jgi:hypothetical protein
MADLNSICNTILKDVSDALGVAIIDLSSGLPLAVAHNIPYFTQSYIDAVAAASVDMFRGKTVSTVERLLSQQRGSEVKHSIQEIQMATAGTYHFMTIVPSKPNTLVVLITSRKASLGMGWSAVRNALPDIEPLVK